MQNSADGHNSRLLSKANRERDIITLSINRKLIEIQLNIANNEEKDLEENYHLLLLQVNSTFHSIEERLVQMVRDKQSSAVAHLNSAFERKETLNSEIRVENKLKIKQLNNLLKDVKSSSDAEIVMQSSAMKQEFNRLNEEKTRQLSSTINLEIQQIDQNLDFIDSIELVHLMDIDYNALEVRNLFF